MATGDSAIFLQVPDQSDRRVLRPGKLLAGHGKARTAEFQERHLTVEAQQEVLVFYELNNKFMRQAARIEVVSRTPHGTVIDLQTTGEPELAESRQCYRVSAVMLDMTATVDGEDDCSILDVSATGMAVTATRRHDVGQAVNVEIRYEETPCAGRMHIATIHRLPRERIRYGLLCIDDHKTNSHLIKGLTRINLAIQRLHLRRLAQSG